MPLFDKTKNSWTIDQNGGNGWQIIQSDNTEIAVTSFDYCMRSFTVDVNYLPENIISHKYILIFRTSVRGTPPQTNDLWNAGIEFYNEYQQFLGGVHMKSKAYSKSLMKGEMLQAETDWKEHTIEFSTSRIPEADAQKIRFIRFFEIGKDVEYWAGNYGAQFKSEFISAVKYSQDKDITSYLPPKRVCELPIHTYLNDGLGDSLFIDGKRQWSDPARFYNNYSDFDFNFPYRSMVYCHHNLSLSQYVSEAWNGGSSLKFEGVLAAGESASIKLFKTQIAPKDRLFCDLNFKLNSGQIDLSVLAKFDDGKTYAFVLDKRLPRN